MGKRRRFTQEFKLEAVRLLEAGSLGRNGAFDRGARYVGLYRTRFLWTLV